MEMPRVTAGDPANPAILFLHGAGISGWMWAAQMESLSSRYHCIAVDLPGFGKNAAVPWVSLSHAAEQLARLIVAQTRWGSAHLVGLSLGGHLALRVLAEHPRVCGDVIISGVTTRPFSAPRTMRLLFTLLSGLGTTPLMLKLSARAMKVPAALLDRFTEDMTVSPPAVTRAVFDEVLHARVPEALREASGFEGAAHRVLAVAGSREHPKIRAELPEFTRLIPGARAAYAPDSGHLWTVEHPELFTRMIDDWFGGNQVTPGLTRLERDTA
jgi:pimeloyl-ACP methyl ester carboxylesterase